MSIQMPLAPQAGLLQAPAVPSMIDPAQPVQPSNLMAAILGHVLGQNTAEDNAAPAKKKPAGTGKDSAKDGAASGSLMDQIMGFAQQLNDNSAPYAADEKKNKNSSLIDTSSLKDVQTVLSIVKLFMGA